MTSRGARGKDNCRSGRLGEAPECPAGAAGAAARLDGNTPGVPDHARRFLDESVVGGHLGQDPGPPGQGVGTYVHRGGLRVERQVEVEWPRLPGVKDRRRSPPQRIAQRARCVQRVGSAHQCRDAPEESLFGFRHLLHVVAFTAGRFVTIDVVEPDAIGRGGKGPGHRLEGARSDRRHHGGCLAVDPAQCRARMGHFDLVAELVSADQPGLFIDPERLRELRRTMTEDHQVLGDALAHQPQNKRFGERQGHGPREVAGADGLLQSAKGRQPRRAPAPGVGDHVRYPCSARRGRSAPIPLRQGRI